MQAQETPDRVQGAEEAGLLERELELGAVDSLLERTREGRGGRLLIEGPAGIGKSVLLAATRDRAARSGMLCLAAEASELSPQLAFIVVRQLLAAAALSTSAPDAPGTFQQGVRQVLELTERSPVLIAVDDVHWADAASLRWLGLLAERAATSRLAVAFSLRVGEVNGADPSLRRLVDDRQAVVVRPAPLSERAAAEVVSRRLGNPLEATLARVCHAETSGNPYLLRALGDALRQAGVPSGPKAPGRLREIGARAVTRVTQHQLESLDQDARELVQAAAVVGDIGGVAELAAIIGLDPSRAADAAQRLAEIDLLRSAHATELSHPLVGGAIRAELSAERRERLIRLAADRLATAGRLEESAARLVELPPRGEQAISERLAEAARRAAERGAPDVAGPLLRRALAEPPPPERRAAMQAAMGRAMLSFGDPEAITAFEHALAGTPPGAEAAALAGLLAQALNYARRTREAIPVLDAVRGGLSDQQAALEEELEALTLHYLSFDPGMRSERMERLARRGDRRGASELAYRMRLAELASESLITCRAATETVTLAERALAGGKLLSEDFNAHMKAVVTLAYAGRPVAARVHVQDAIAQTRMRGDTVTLGLAMIMHGEIRRLEGDMIAVEADTRTGLELLPPGEVGPRFALRGLIESLVEQDDPFTAQDELRRGHLTGQLPEIMPTPGLLLARGNARIAAGSVQLGLEDLLQAGEIAERLELRDPISVPWRLAAAEALLGLGDTEHAAKLAAEHLELARRMGAAEAIGAGLRVHGRVTGGPSGLEALHEAVELLQEGFARLELARALVDLGVARREAHPGPARHALEQGIALAGELGATTLAARAREQLVAAGGRPRRAVRRGVRALTPSERRVARLAAEGMTNREIADALVVTEKTVESHLGAAFRKLGLRSRAELADTLARADNERRPVALPADRVPR